MRLRARDVPSAVWRHAAWRVRDLFADRHVVREVQGVRMVLPWSHRLPDYVRHGPQYGQNLVHLSRLLAETGPLTVLDIGANVGDSALQVLNAADARILCVEGDPAYLEYLHINTDDDPRVTVVEALVVTAEGAAPTTAVRKGGTTRFEAGGAEHSMATTTPARLRETQPGFDRLRLAKSDTDGYDVALIPAVAAAWHDDPPVLFFEYDHGLSRLAGLEPLDVWPALGDLGYDLVAVWDNGGRPLGRASVAEIAPLTRVLDSPQDDRRISYWDVAVVHRDDAAGRKAVESLVSGSLTARPSSV